MISFLRARQNAMPNWDIKGGKFEQLVRFFSIYGSIKGLILSNLRLNKPWDTRERVSYLFNSFTALIR